MGLSGCSELQKPKISLKAEILLSGSETELPSEDLSRANECSVCSTLPIPKCHFSDVVCMIRMRKSKIKKLFHFSPCVHIYPLLSIEGHPRIQTTKLRENIPMIITDVCMGLALEKKKKIEINFVPQFHVRMSGLSRSGSLNRTNSIQIMPGHTMTFLLD